MINGTKQDADIRLDRGQIPGVDVMIKTLSAIPCSIPCSRIRLEMIFQHTLMAEAITQNKTTLWLEKLQAVEELLKEKSAVGLSSLASFLRARRSARRSYLSEM